MLFRNDKDKKDPGGEDQRGGLRVPLLPLRDIIVFPHMVVPLFVGFDTDAEDPDHAGRIISYDITGGRYNEVAGYHAVGSGSLFAKSALKKRFEPQSDQQTAVRIAIEALYDAADDDTATGGPDLTRRIYPSVITINGVDGAVRMPEEQTAEIATEVVNRRMENPGG